MKKNIILNNKFIKTQKIYLENKLNVNSIHLSKLLNISIKKILDIINKLDPNLTQNNYLNKDILLLLAEELKINIIFNNNYINLINKRLKGNIKINRSPIVTIMGHVNHGKTSLLDYIKKSNLISKEVGGITQKINAYNVNTNYGDITFIDTPGHEIFKNMLNKGIKFTDIIILVVAANDGIKPQTINAIQFSQKLKLPIIVVINKIDLNNNIVIIKNELNKYNIVPIEWGGNNEFIKTSVKLGIGIDNLLKTIIKVSKKIDLICYKNGMSKGNILDAYIDKKKGIIINVIIMDGCLNKGDIIVSGEQYGKIKKIIINDNKEINNAFPGMSVKILGLSNLIKINEEFIVVNNEEIAKKIIIFHKENNILNSLNNFENIEDVFNDDDNNSIFKILNIILKTDTEGSKEAIDNLFIKLQKKYKEIKFNIINKEIGIISKDDIFLALNTNAYIIGFNVDLDNISKLLFKNKKLKILFFKTIYDLLDSLKSIIKKILNDNEKDNIIGGEAIIKNIFISNNSKNSFIFGCKVINGNININDKINIYRKDTLIFNGKIKSLKHFKKKVDVVTNGLECGIIIHNKNKLNNLIFKIGDNIKTIKN